jgi:hypothetical protein
MPHYCQHQRWKIGHWLLTCQLVGDEHPLLHRHYIYIHTHIYTHSPFNIDQSEMSFSHLDIEYDQWLTTANKSPWLAGCATCCSAWVLHNTWPPCDSQVYLTTCCKESIKEFRARFYRLL